MGNHSELPKCCCIHCSKEVYNRYLSKHLKSCKMLGKTRNVDYVICPICGKRLKEINHDHLRAHSMSVKEFDAQFPQYDRLSEISRQNKNTLGDNLTEEISKKLKFGHTIDGYIEKWGEKEGRQRFEKRTNNIKYARTKDYYIERWGEEEGRRRWDSMISKKSSNSKRNWEEKYDMLAKSRSFDGYIEKYGEEEGRRRWLAKNLKNSESSKKIAEDQVYRYKMYICEVYRITNITLRNYDLPNIDLRSREWQLDHKLSICYGFLKNISPYMIGSIYNLEMVPVRVNASKQDKCSIEYYELKKLFEADEFYKELKELEDEIRTTGTL